MQEQSTYANSNLGHKLRKLRELRNFTQEKVAEHLGLSVAGYSRIERGEVKITLDKLEAISALLGLQTSDLLSFDESYFFSNHGNAYEKSFSVNRDEDAIAKIEKLYQDQIAQLKEKIAYLRSVIDKKL